MNIVICGAGEVGRHTADELGTHGNNITIIDLDMNKLALVEQAMDVRILHGNATHVDLLREAGWDDRAIHDGCQVIAYFNYINRIADGLGVDPEPAS